MSGLSDFFSGTPGWLPEVPEKITKKSNRKKKVVRKRAKLARRRNRKR